MPRENYISQHAFSNSSAYIFWDTVHTGVCSVSMWLTLASYRRYDRTLSMLVLVVHLFAFRLTCGTKQYFISDLRKTIPQYTLCNIQ